MSSLSVYQINAYAFILLLMIYIHQRRNERRLYINRIFSVLITATLALLVIDSMAWVFNEKPGTCNIELNYIFNMLLYLLAIVPPGLWLVYADFQIFGDRRRSNRLMLCLLPLLLLNTVLTLTSPANGLYFFVDAANSYHRGPWFIIHVAIAYGLLAFTSVYIFHNRKRIDPRHFKSMLLYPLLPFAGSVLQIIFFGLSLNWSCTVLSIFIVYFNIQDWGLNTDYLTGVFNRRLLDNYLKERIRNSRKGRSFSAILIDMDNFKRINDTYGHIAGDEVLQQAVSLMRSCIRNDDMIARFGGDEFYIVLDISDIHLLIEVVQRIRSTLEEYNAQSNLPYLIDFSMGYDVYSSESGMTADAFIRHVDALMYQDKQAKSASSPVPR